MQLKISRSEPRYLADNYDIDVGVARKLWAFGPEGRGPNLLFDASRGQTNFGDIKDTIMAGFEWATSEVRINFVFFVKITENGILQIP